MNPFPSFYHERPGRLHSDSMGCMPTNRRTMSAQLSRSSRYYTYHPSESVQDWERPQFLCMPQFSLLAGAIAADLRALKIDVRTPQDVAAAFRFSKKTGVTLVIKNTGVGRVGFHLVPRLTVSCPSSTIMKGEVAHQTHWRFG